MPNVIVQTRRGSQVLKPWYGCVLAEEASVSDVYSGGILDSGRTASVEATRGSKKLVPYLLISLGYVDMAVF